MPAIGGTPPSARPTGRRIDRPRSPTSRMRPSPESPVSDRRDQRLRAPGETSQPGRTTRVWGWAVSDRAMSRSHWRPAGVVGPLSPLLASRGHGGAARSVPISWASAAATAGRRSRPKPGPSTRGKWSTMHCPSFGSHPDHDDHSVWTFVRVISEPSKLDPLGDEPSRPSDTHDQVRGVQAP
jgi:hypothetical protein